MSAILQSFLCGLSFSVGMFAGVAGILWSRSASRKAVEAHHKITEELL